MTSPDPYQTALSQYGAIGVFAQSNPELSAKLQEAIANQWDAARFQRELWTTNWYKSLNDNQQQLQVLQATDPAQYNNVVLQKANQIQLQAQSIGLAGIDYNAVAKLALQNNWDNATLQWYMNDKAGGHLANTGGALIGSSGEYQQHIYNTLASYGVPINDQFVNEQVKQIQAGQQTIGGVDTQVWAQARRLYPQYATDFDEGRTLSDIAKPYIQQMATTLELDPSAIKLTDPTIQKALQGDGTNATPLYAFQQQVKQDPRWQQTDNAKNAAYDTLAQIGKDWGFQ